MYGHRCVVKKACGALAQMAYNGGVGKGAGGNLIHSRWASLGRTCHCKPQTIPGKRAKYLGT